MKKILILLCLIICYVQLSSQHIMESDADSIYIFADDDFSNVEIFTKIIHNKIDSVIKTRTDCICCGEVKVCFIINEIGKVDSCYIQKSFRDDIDKLIINTLSNIDFKAAPVYTLRKKPIRMKFTLPIRWK